LGYLHYWLRIVMNAFTARVAVLPLSRDTNQFVVVHQEIKI